MNAWINGIGCVSPVGIGPGRTFSIQPLCSGTLKVPGRKQIFPGPDKRFGRLDDFSRIGLAALAFCLRDANAEAWQEKRSVGIVATSRYGCLETDRAYQETIVPEGGKLASPNLFAYTLPNSFLGEAALRFGLTGNCLILNRSDPSRLSALEFALEELAWSDQQGMLAGICDLPDPLGGEEDRPGSFFLLLEREQRCGGSYGSLSLKQGEFQLDGKPVADLGALLNECLVSGD